MFHRLMLVAIVALPVSVTAGPAQAIAASEPPGIHANYYGRLIDLSEGWGSARACVIDGVSGECFNTAAELDTYLREERTANSNGIAALATCGTGTRLYAGTSYGTPVLTVTTRLTWINLASVGFDNRTRSYRIGSCAASMAKNSDGGGGFYPGATGAYAQSSSMAAGWDRAVSSIYLY